MFEDYNLVKFVVVFTIIVGSLFGIYLYINKFGSFPVSNLKSNIKIIEVRHIGKDKGFILAQVKNKSYFFSFDNSGIKLIEKFEKDVDEENRKKDNH
ncbi:MAG: hypothetical protein DSY47_01330 [Hydrogenothermus sp.]|nr:MAG: hypothetical protein DSY47_01330 [Hydrogenothermus sp.]